MKPIDERKLGETVWVVVLPEDATYYTIRQARVTDVAGVPGLWMNFDFVMARVKTFDTAREATEHLLKVLDDKEKATTPGGGGGTNGGGDGRAERPLVAT